MAPGKSKEDIESLDKGEVGAVEEVGFGQSMLQTESEFEAQLPFCGTEIGYYLHFMLAQHTEETIYS